MVFTQRSSNRFAWRGGHHVSTHNGLVSALQVVAFGFADVLALGTLQRFHLKAISRLDINRKYFLRKKIASNQRCLGRNKDVILGHRRQLCGNGHRKSVAPGRQRCIQQTRPSNVVLWKGSHLRHATISFSRPLQREINDRRSSPLLH